MSEAGPVDRPGDGGRGADRSARLIHPVDAVVALLIIAVSAWLWYETSQFDEVSFLLTQNVPPELFPRLLLVILILLSLALPFEHILLRRKGKDIDKGRRDSVRPISWLTMALLVAIAGASPWLGTFLTMAAVCLLLPLLWGERRLHFVLPFAALFPAAVTLVFNIVLGVYFEPGMLGINFQ